MAAVYLNFEVPLLKSFQHFPIIVLDQLWLLKVLCFSLSVSLASFSSLRDAAFVVWCFSVYQLIVLELASRNWILSSSSKLLVIGEKAFEFIEWTFYLSALQEIGCGNMISSRDFRSSVVDYISVSFRKGNDRHLIGVLNCRHFQRGLGVACASGATNAAKVH